MWEGGEKKKKKTLGKNKKDMRAGKNNYS